MKVELGRMVTGGPSHCHSNREFAISTSSDAVHLGCGKAPHSKSAAISARSSSYPELAIYRSATGVTGVEAVAARGSRQCIILVAVGAPQRLIS